MSTTDTSAARGAALIPNAMLRDSGAPVPLAIQLRGVTKSFGDDANRVPALRGIDLDIPAGEMAMLVGPSGCGKTTLIQVMSAILDADAGSVRVFEQELTTLDSAAKGRFRRETIGFCFQQFNLIPTLSATENAAIPLLIARTPRAEALERARAELDALGLGDKLDRFPRELSGGQQQRVALARAVVHHPRLLVCDEPTSALDHRAGMQAMELLRSRLLAPGRVIVIVTHDARILSFGDRVCSMDDGRIISTELATHAASQASDTRRIA